MTDDQLFSFAQKCAKAYCSEYGAWSQEEDAVQEACVFLLKNRAKWDLPDSTLRTRTVLALVRWYQNENGLRRKTRLQRVDLDVELVEERKDDALAIIDAALERFPYEQDIIRDLIAGFDRKTVAKNHKIRLSEVDRIFKEFKSELCKFSDLPVKGEKESCPLLYAM